MSCGQMFTEYEMEREKGRVRNMWNLHDRNEEALFWRENTERKETTFEHGLTLTNEY